MKKPFLIIIDGPIGSGKTTVSELLHKKLRKTALISLDKIKRLVSDYKPMHKYHQLASEVGKAMVKEYLKNELDSNESVLLIISNACSTVNFFPVTTI